MCRPLPDEAGSHLAQVRLLASLERLRLVSADFYNHGVFTALQGGLTRLELEDCDEMNLNSLIMIGDKCPHLSSLHISRCHFNVDMEERNKINELCSKEV